MDLVLNNLQRLICHKTQTTKQNLLSLAQKEHSRTFLLWQYMTTSHKTRKTNSDFSSFIRSGCVLPQQNSLAMVFFF